MPVYQVEQFKSGTKLVLLNQGSNETKFRENIYKHITMIMRNTNTQALKRNWNLAYQNGGVSLEVMAKNFATISGLPENLFLSFDRGLLASFYERFGQLLTQQESVAPQEVAAKLSEFFYTTKKGSAYQKTLLNYLLTFNAITNDLTVGYTIQKVKKKWH